MDVEGVDVLPELVLLNTLESFECGDEVTHEVTPPLLEAEGSRAMRMASSWRARLLA
jgi:hypothetical protein